MLVVSAWFSRIFPPISLPASPSETQIWLPAGLVRTRGRRERAQRFLTPGLLGSCPGVFTQFHMSNDEGQAPSFKTQVGFFLELREEE